MAEEIEVIKKKFKKFSDCQLIGALMFIKNFERKSNTEQHKYLLHEKIIERIIIEEGTSEFNILMNLLKQGYVLEEIKNNDGSPNVKMVNGKLYGVYHEGDEEVSELILKTGKWRPIVEDIKKFDDVKKQLVVL